MAETILSPGVLTRENDQSQITAAPVEAGAAIIGPAVKGPVNKPTLVTSFSQYNAIFGNTVESGSQTRSYMTSIAAYNYFTNGGNSLLVTRVASGSFTAADSTDILAHGSISASININTGSAFTLATLGEGDIMNSSGSDNQGALSNGTADNVRWEITSANTSSGTFSLTIRRGNDTHRSKAVLETWNDLSLDPTSPRYIEEVIGNQTENLILEDNGDYYIQPTGEFRNNSRFVRVKEVLRPTPQYFDALGNAKAEFTGSIPTVASGSFTGATGALFSGSANFYDDVAVGNIQGLEGANYNTALQLLGNRDEFRFNIISMPGLTSQNASAQVTSMVNLATDRGDCIAVVDLVNYQASEGAVIAQAAGFDNSYAASYWPWVQTIDSGTGRQVWVPAGVVIPGVYAFTDRSAASWFAPAGLTRGALGNVVRAERKLPAATRDRLYAANINPIATFPRTGVVVFGQKTLQKRATALDRVNVRRLLIALKGFISQIADTLVFEQNTITTRNSFLRRVNPYLESVVQRQGLYAFKVVMDDTNNTADVVDRNELVGQIFLQPTRTAEYIILDFNVLPTGATFPA